AHASISAHASCRRVSPAVVNAAVAPASHGNFQRRDRPRAVIAGDRVIDSGALLQNRSRGHYGRSDIWSDRTRGGVAAGYKARLCTGASSKSMTAAVVNTGVTSRSK